ncbi:MAG TPA: hypothetical protein VIM11_04805 [Tepidisphaeraceae bacterium]|jgi:hypothetical protein
MDGNGQAIQVVDRRSEIPAGAQEPAPFTTMAAPVRTHEGRAFLVSSEIVLPTITDEGQLKGPPEIRLRWKFKPGHKGRIVGYRRVKGFGAPGEFGEMIVNSTVEGEKREHLDPTDYFYNFFTRSSILGLWHIYSNDIQFLETVPSIANILLMLRNANDFTEQRQKYVKLVTPPPKPKEPEDPLDVWKRDLATALASVDIRFESADRFAEQWEAKRRAIDEEPGSENAKLRRKRALDGTMRKIREQFEL